MIENIYIWVLFVIVCLIALIPIEVYKRIPKVATRVTIYYNDGTNNTIDTGIVTISQ